VIHGEIYKARPDVNAVAHHHAMPFLPFCNSGEELLPLYHMGAQIGEKVPFWDSRDEFGDTNLLVLKPEEGRSLAKALGPYWLVLMRRRNLMPRPQARAWEYWSVRLKKAGEYPAGAPKSATRAASRPARKPSATRDGKSRAGRAKRR
jgi:hypothetical protein